MPLVAWRCAKPEGFVGSVFLSQKSEIPPRAMFSDLLIVKLDCVRGFLQLAECSPEFIVIFQRPGPRRDLRFGKGSFEDYASFGCCFVSVDRWRLLLRHEALTYSKDFRSLLAA